MTGSQQERHLIDATLDVEGRDMHAISWHGAWGPLPEDSPETLKQAQTVANYIRGLNAPFILTGDLNVGPTTKTVAKINTVANNLMDPSRIKQTTHPTVHKIAPEGFLVDYIFTSSHFKARSIKVPKIVVSDHLPVIAELEFDRM